MLIRSQSNDEIFDLSKELKMFKFWLKHGKRGIPKIKYGQWFC